MTRTTHVDRVTLITVQSAQRFVRGKKDPAKMTYAKLALVERGLGTKRAHTQSQSAVLSRLSVHLMLMRAGDLRHEGSIPQAYLSSPLRRSPRAPSLSPSS